MGLGKWIAGVLGWAMFGPIGGILGFWFGQNWRMQRLQLEVTVTGHGIKGSETAS